MYPNVPHEEKLKLLARVTEHFGIAPVEAMASGLALIVPKLSGTWTDICDFGRYGLGYTKLSVGEIIPLIEDALARWNKFQTPIEHVEKFSVEMFYAKMRKIVESLLLEYE